MANVCRIFHSDRISPGWFGIVAQDISWESVDHFFETGIADRHPAVVIVDASIGARIRATRMHARHVVFVAADAASERALAPRRDISVAGVKAAAARARLLQAACELACARAVASRRGRRLVRMRRAISELNRIGLRLMQERDEHELLREITSVGKRLTQSDAAALLVAEYDGDVPARLHLACADFDTIPDLETPIETLAIDDTSIIGHAAKTGKPIVIADAYDLPPDASFVMNPEFDERNRYRRRSMLIVPMVDHRGHLVGVMAFVNRKSNPRARITTKRMADRYVLPYGKPDLRLARALAGQAAVTLENTRLYEQIERMLESFVKASVTAIDQRDPATAGHSLRVAALSAALAEAVDGADRGALATTRFTRAQLRELRFAALLHDFGKVAVREEVLAKAKKLPRVLWERVNARFDVIYRTLEVESRHPRSRKRRRASPERCDALEEVLHMRDVVMTANEPSVTDHVPPSELEAIAARTFRQPDGTVMPYLTAEELHYLQLPCGTLDGVERAEIESHVEETYQFLVKIPWTDDLKHVATFAYGHHEKLNGSGYPRQLKSSEIPIQTRIITIADIFDALTEADRPYKPAVSVERALGILRSEAKAGRLDADLVRILIESESHRTLFQDR